MNGYEDVNDLESSEVEDTEHTHSSEGSEDEVEEEGDIGEKAPFFGDNPVYLRRYQFVSDLLKNESWTKDIKRLVDVGANNCEFLYRLRNNGGMRHLREVIALDVDEPLLKWHRRKTEPLNIGHLLKEHMRRFYPLDVYHMVGSVGETDDRLKNVDAVIAIELIEHLYPATLKLFPEVVFGHMKPKLVIITTPNREFNVLFPDFKGPFRHWDHKFEFTRAEFVAWSKEISETYPEYSVSFNGVGEQPPNMSEEDLGFCSQIAVFVKKDFKIAAQNGNFAHKERGSFLDPNINLVEKHQAMSQNNQLYPYQVAVHHHAEHCPDERSMELRCYHTLNSHIKELAAIDKEYYQDDEDSVNPKIYFDRIKNQLKEYCYDDYGDEYPELTETKVGEILSKYKDDFTSGHDENGVYFLVNEDYWNIPSSEDESEWDIDSSTSHQELENIEKQNDNIVEGDSDSDWSEVDRHEFQNIVVPPVSLNKEEVWSD